MWKINNTRISAISKVPGINSTFCKNSKRILIPAKNDEKIMKKI